MASTVKFSMVWSTAFCCSVPPVTVSVAFTVTPSAYSATRPISEMVLPGDVTPIMDGLMNLGVSIRKYSVERMDMPR